MSDSRPFVLEFGLKIFLPTLVAAAGISLLILHVFNAIFLETDGLDNAYARRSAQAALLTLRDKMETLVQDNAYWDDAVRNSNSTAGNGWMQDTWGIADVQNIYDASFVVDAGGKTIFASIRGDANNSRHLDIHDYFGAGIDTLLGQLPAEGSTFAKTSAFLSSGGIVSVAGAGVIVPWSKGVVLPGNRPLRLIFAKTIGPSLLADLSRQFALDDMHFTAAGEKPAIGIDVRSPSAQQLAVLSWSARSPGATLRAKFGDIVWAVLTLFLLVVGVLVYMSWRGFKQAHESKAEAIAASLRDDLTGLANRRELMKVLAERIATAPAGKTGLSVVYADLDGFKEVNDAYGHEIGDQLLKSAAAGFAFLAEGTDLVSRLGGDEFAIVVSGPDAQEQSRRLGQNMIAFLEEPMVFGGRVASVSVSVGIVDFDSGSSDIEEILRRADVAMYAAKTAGRSRIHIYDASLDSKRDESRAIARELRSAIDQKKLGVVYQPIVDSRTRRTMGVEALVRWPKDSPRRCTPDIFVPVAEEFGLIEDLGRFVMMEACRQAANWPGIFVSVNVSPIQFMNPNFAEMVERALNLTGLEARRLEIEVTEGFVIDNAERATAIIDRLHDMRVSVALDDFGTGYSSIGHLRRFKFDKLKLDRSMVMDILRQPSALRLVQGTIAMADALGLRVTAEGVEDENQVSVLRLAGCSMFQGFLFSRPVEARDIPAFLGTQITAIAV